MNTTRPTPIRLADTIANQLEQRILEGSLKPGDRLPPEREFALELGVSRPSLREAMQKLVSKGLLSTRHGGGTFVTDRLEAYFVDPWQDMLKSQPFLHRDLLEFRQMLETQAAALAAERATDVDILRLDAAYAALDEAYTQGDLPACVVADVAFHQAIAEASHNLLIGHLRCGDGTARSGLHVHALQIAGDATHTLAEDGTVSTASGFVQKPFTAGALTRKISEVLGN